MAASIGISYHMGWFACAVVTTRGHKLIVQVTGRVETANDRESKEPFHVAGGWLGLKRAPVPDDPEKIVKIGLARQKRISLGAVKQFLKATGVPEINYAGILVGRGRRATTLQEALNSHTQIHMAEAHAVCDNIESALEALKINIVRIDRKTLFEQSAAQLKLDEGEIQSMLNLLVPGEGPWRQEEKRCAVAAWLAMTD